MDKIMRVAQLRSKIGQMDRIANFFEAAYDPTINLYNQQAVGRPVVNAVHISGNDEKELFNELKVLVKDLRDRYAEELAMVESTYTLGELIAASSTVTGIQYVLYIMEAASGKGVSDRTDIVAKHTIGPTSASGINQWILGMLPSQGGNGDWSKARVIYHTIDENKIMRVVIESLPKD